MANQDDMEVTNLQDVIEAYREISRAEERYRETLRAAIAEGVTQTAISRALDRTREMIRQDAMSEEQRAEMRRAAANRQQRRRESKATKPSQ